MPWFLAFFRNPNRQGLSPNVDISASSYTGLNATYPSFIILPLLLSLKSGNTRRKLRGHPLEDSSHWAGVLRRAGCCSDGIPGPGWILLLTLSCPAVPSSCRERMLRSYVNCCLIQHPSLSYRKISFKISKYLGKYFRTQTGFIWIPIYPPANLCHCHSLRSFS